MPIIRLTNIVDTKDRTKETYLINKRVADKETFLKHHKQAWTADVFISETFAIVGKYEVFTLIYNSEDITDKIKELFPLVGSLRP